MMYLFLNQRIHSSLWHYKEHIHCTLFCTTLGIHRITRTINAGRKSKQLNISIPFLMLKTHLNNNGSVYTSHWYMSNLKLHIFYTMNLVQSEMLCTYFSIKTLTLIHYLHLAQQDNKYSDSNSEFQTRYCTISSST
jgi:hypothetical protein